MPLVTPQTLESSLRRIAACDVPTVDIETSGLRRYHGDYVIGVAVEAENESMYFPVRHGCGFNFGPAVYQELLAELSKHPYHLGFNYKFDLQFLVGDGMKMPTRAYDPMLSAHLLNENEKNFQLKELSAKYLGDESKDAQSALVGRLRELGFGKGEMWKLPASEVAEYACDDVKLTRRLADFHRPFLDKYSLTELWGSVCDYQRVLTQLEMRGMLVDPAIIEGKIIECDEQSDRAYGRLADRAGYKINPNSPKQVCAFLRTESSRAEILEQLATPEAELVRTYRDWTKVRNTYYRKFLTSMDAGFFIHPNLRMTGTVTGRLSCSDPNLQAIPRETQIYTVKDCFVARPGYYLVEADYSQAELRMTCHYGRERNMAALLIAGQDIHSATAEFLKIPRFVAKQLNFSVVFGVGAATLSERLKISIEEAARFLALYHGRYPGFRRLYRACDRQARKDGYIRLQTGRMRHFNCPRAPTHKASSNLSQGSVAEMLRLAMLRIDEELSGEDVHQLMQVHDSLLFEIPIGSERQLLPLIRHCMEDFSFDPPPRVDIKIGTTWGNVKPWTGG